MYMYINMCPRGVLHILHVHVYIFVLYLASYYVTSTAVNRVHVKKTHYMYVPIGYYTVYAIYIWSTCIHVHVLCTKVSRFICSAHTFFHVYTCTSKMWM